MAKPLAGSFADLIRAINCTVQAIRQRRLGLPVTDFERRQLEAVQAELDAEYQTRIGRSTAPSQPKISSTQRP